MALFTYIKLYGALYGERPGIFGGWCECGAIYIYVYKMGGRIGVWVDDLAPPPV